MATPETLEKLKKSRMDNGENFYSPQRLLGEQDFIHLIWNRNAFLFLIIFIRSSINFSKIYYSFYKVIINA